MKDNPSSGNEVEQDARLLQVQGQLARLGRSIWDTEDCDNCGVCCYMFTVASVKKTEQYTNCEHQDVQLGKSYCNIQDAKSEGCNGFGCYRPVPGMSGTSKQRLEMMKMAVYSIRTKTEEDLERVSDVTLLTNEEMKTWEEKRKLELLSEVSSGDEIRKRKALEELIELV